MEADPWHNPRWRPDVVRCRERRLGHPFDDARRNSHECVDMDSVAQPTATDDSQVITSEMIRWVTVVVGLGTIAAFNLPRHPTGSESPSQEPRASRVIHFAEEPPYIHAVTDERSEGPRFRAWFRVRVENVGNAPLRGVRAILAASDRSAAYIHLATPFRRMHDEPPYVKSHGFILGPGASELIDMVLSEQTLDNGRRHHLCYAVTDLVDQFVTDRLPMRLTIRAESPDSSPTEAAFWRTPRRPRPSGSRR